MVSFDDVRHASVGSDPVRCYGSISLLLQCNAWSEVEGIASLSLPFFIKFMFASEKVPVYTVCHLAEAI